MEIALLRSYRIYMELLIPSDTLKQTDDGRFYIFNYHSYRLFGERNPSFDSISGRLLDLKESKGDAIDHFFSVLDPLIGPNVTVCVVPSHSADKVTANSGIGRIVNKLCAGNRVNGVNYLVRHTTIPKLAHGGDRSCQTHKDSITVQANPNLAGTSVVLLDDITTTGNSLLACRDLLLDAGAGKVTMLSIARTI